MERMFLLNQYISSLSQVYTSLYMCLLLYLISYLVCACLQVGQLIAHVCFICHDDCWTLTLDKKDWKKKKKREEEAGEYTKHNNKNKVLWYTHCVHLRVWEKNTKFQSIWFKYIVKIRNLRHTLCSVFIMGSWQTMSVFWPASKSTRSTTIKDTVHHINSNQYIYRLVVWCKGSFMLENNYFALVFKVAWMGFTEREANKSAHFSHGRHSQCFT